MALKKTLFTLLLSLLAAFPLASQARTTSQKAPSKASSAAAETTTTAENITPPPSGDAVGTTRYFNALIDRVEAQKEVSGLAVAIVKDKRVLLQRGIGFADTQTRTPITPDTVFRLASLSKAFASALAGLLIRDGAFAWDTRIAEVLPSFELQDAKASEKLTVRDILAQRVGLPNNTYDKLLEADEPYAQLVDQLRDVPLSCDVGECYGYQNIAYSLIGDIIYTRTGDFYPHQVEKRLFRPLGMTSATYGKDALEASRDWAHPHAHVRGDEWVPFEIRDAYYHVAPAAGVNASIKDMTQWLIAQMGGRPDVLPAELLQTLHTPQIPTPAERRSTAWRRVRLNDASYALGWRVFDYAGEPLVFHAGAVKGYRSIIAFFPESRFGAVMLWNCESGAPMGLMPMLLDRYLGLAEMDWAGLDAPPPLPRQRVRTAKKKLRH